MSEVLDVKQAAELLQVHPVTVRNLAAGGEIPGRKLGGQWRFSRAALLRWLGAPPPESAPGDEVLRDAASSAARFATIVPSRRQARPVDAELQRAVRAALGRDKRVPTQ